MVKDESIDNSAMLDVCLAEPRLGDSQLWILGLTLHQFGKISEPRLNADTESYTSGEQLLRRTVYEAQHELIHNMMSLLTYSTVL